MTARRACCIVKRVATLNRSTEVRPMESTRGMLVAAIAFVSGYLLGVIVVCTLEALMLR